MIDLKAYFNEFTIATKKRWELVDITRQVTDFVQECVMESGICLIHTPHSTAAIIVNEHEMGLMKDVIRNVQEYFSKDADWLHNRIDNNADSHLASIFLGHSKIFPVKNGRLYKGTWQNVFLIELDGPRTRHIICEVLGI